MTGIDLVSTVLLRIVYKNFDSMVATTSLMYKKVNLHARQESFWAPEAVDGS